MLVEQKARRLEWENRRKSSHLCFEKGLFLLMPLWTASKIKEHLTKEAQNPYARNWRSVIKEDLNKWEMYYPWIIRFNSKMLVFPKLFYWVKAILVQISTSFLFEGIDELVPTFMCKCKGPRTALMIFRKCIVGVRTYITWTYYRLTIML